MSDHYTMPPPVYPYCGRIDEHPPHGRCPGPPLTEGAVPCTDCRQPTRNGGALCTDCRRLRDEYEQEKRT